MRLSDSDLKQFRRSVAALKKAGLIPPKNRNGNPIVVKSARPEQLVQGKRLIDYVRDSASQDVLRGKAVALPASRVKDREGFKLKRVKGGSDRVVVPLPEDASVETEKGRIVITHRSPSGSIRRIKVPRKNLRQYLEDASKLPELKKGDRYAFYLGGGKSFVMSPNADLLIEELLAYKIFEDTPESDILSHLEIVQISQSAVPAWRRDVDERIRKQRRGSRTKAERRRIANVPEFKRPALRAKRAAARRRQRAKK